MLIKRVRAGTECCAIGEEQCGFRQGRGCTHQVFAARQVCEKYLSNGKDVFWAFMDLEKAYDTIDRHFMWQMLRMYGVGGKLLKAVQSFSEDSRACVRVGNDVSEWFQVNVGLRVLGKGLELLSANGGGFEINQLLFADNTALVADSEEKLCRLVSEFGRVCES